VRRINLFLVIVLDVVAIDQVVGLHRHQRETTHTDYPGRSLSRRFRSILRRRQHCPGGLSSHLRSLVSVTLPYIVGHCGPRPALNRHERPDCFSGSTPSTERSATRRRKAWGCQPAHPRCLPALNS